MGSAQGGNPDAAQRQQAATAAALQQLCDPRLPPYVILSSDAWPQLVSLLPALLQHPASTRAGGTAAAAAAQELLLQQLAPELLHCSPEPLAQLLAALLRHAVVAPPLGRTSAAANFAAPVLQLAVSGLHKLGRQWHFLQPEVAQQLCSAIAAALAQALRQLRASPPQQPVAQQPLALQLLLCEPHCGWWHRLLANSASSTALKEAMQQHGVVDAVLLWLQQRQQAGVAAARGQSLPPDSSTELCQCLAAHVLSALVASHSGRCLLQAQAAHHAQQQQADVLAAACSALTSWATRGACAAEQAGSRAAGSTATTAAAGGAAGGAAAAAAAVAAAARAAQLALQAYEQQRPWWDAAV
jgi:hypothetical protein